MTNNLRFAVCIMFPGTNEFDAVQAALVHNVHILDKLNFDPNNDYSSITNLQNKIDGATMFHLLVHGNHSTLVLQNKSLTEELEKLKNLKPIP